MTKIIDLKDIGLTDEQKKQLSDWFETLMDKYQQFSFRSKRGDMYFDGVVQGLNNAYKVVNNIEDEYMHE